MTTTRASGRGIASHDIIVYHIARRVITDHGGGEGFGFGRDPPFRPSGFRERHLERARVQKRSKRVAIVRVGVIPHDGMAAVLEVHPDLMPSTRHRRHLHFGHLGAFEFPLQRARPAREHTKSSLARFPDVGIELDPLAKPLRIVRVASQRNVHRPLVTFRMPEHDGEVGFPRSAFAEEFRRGPRRAFIRRGDQHPARGVIQLMAESHRVPVRVSPLEPILHAQISRVFRREPGLPGPSSGGVEADAPGFIDDDVIRILVRDAEPTLEGLRLAQDALRDGLAAETIVIV